MRRSTLLFALTKTYDPISIDLRDKRREKKSLFLLFSSIRPSISLFFFIFYFLLLYYYYYYYYFLFLIIIFLLYFFIVLYFSLFSPLDTWLNVSHSYKCTTCHAMCHPAPDVSKNVKFRLSRNPIKFDGVTRFRETNSTGKSISSSKI